MDKLYASEAVKCGVKCSVGKETTEEKKCGVGKEIGIGKETGVGKEMIEEKKTTKEEEIKCDLEEKTVRKEITGDKTSDKTRKREHIRMKEYKKWSHKKQKFKTYRYYITWYDDKGRRLKTVKETKYMRVEKHYDSEGRLHRDGDFAYLLSKEGKKTRGYMYHHGERLRCAEVPSLHS